MKKEEDAFGLAKAMVSIGNGVGRKTIAVISDMDQPLGYAVGNALEVKEAIDTLRGNGPEDFVELCLTLGAYMVVSAGKADNENEARKMLVHVIEDGSALDKLAEFVEAQGGDKELVYHPEGLPKASIIEEVLSPVDGYISHIVCDEIGICSLILGGGRETKESEIDLSVGLVLSKKVGDFVKKGEALATIHANKEEQLRTAKERFIKAYTFSNTTVEKKKLIKGIVAE